MAMAINCIRFNPKEQHVFLATSVEGKVHAGSVIDGSVEDIASEPDNEINCLDFSLDGHSFATAGKDLDVRIYDTTTKKRTKVYEGYRYANPDSSSGHAQRIFALKYHPDHEGIFITGGWDNHLKVWDARTEEGVIRTIKGPHICGDSLDIKDNNILTGSWVAKDALQIWDFREGSLVENLPFANNQGEFIYSAQFCDNDTVLAGGSGTNNVQAINTKTKKCIGRLELGHPVQALDSTLGGRLFALGGSGYQLKMATMT
jgi:WD40 repeat protein